MEIINKKEDLKKINTFKNKTVSLVPTMGNLHSGHITLIEKARSESDIVVVSIFVNPTQFGPEEDFSKIKEICDYVYVPNIEDIYNNGFGDINFKINSNIACAKFRDNHFEGVLKIVLKLFNIVKPSKAYFGLKDYQQFILISKMVKELDLNIEIIPVPIVRENGLALSSRNSYLEVKDIEKANSINISLKKAKEAFDKGEKSVLRIKEIVLENLKCDIQYFEIIDENLNKVTILEKGNICLMACFVGSVRLIDNIKF
jgi:pantoate--beta-alanine ligase